MSQSTASNEAEGANKLSMHFCTSSDHSALQFKGRTPSIRHRKPCRGV
ncbi:unnamed protein product [Brugia timori]|uniref:Bm13131 n=2 Tax=Brugia TaxID=6278 RepID=A0A1I9G3I7_BRUMA|nr:Bm13131 [Brugia malayi]VDO40147.1 unnamed protein product [Brugia timori]